MLTFFYWTVVCSVHIIQLRYLPSSMLSQCLTPLHFFITESAAGMIEAEMAYHYDDGGEVSAILVE